MNYQTLKQEVVYVAEVELETCHGEVGSNNSGVYVNRYLNALAPDGSPWCAGFASWCYMNACTHVGLDTIPFAYSVSALNIYNQFKANGWLVDYDYLEPGDLIFFTRVGGGHVGIIKTIDQAHNICSIEGNVGEFPAMVQYRYYFDNGEIKNLLGYGGPR